MSTRRHISDTTFCVYWYCTLCMRTFEGQGDVNKVRTKQVLQPFSICICIHVLSVKYTKAFRQKSVTVRVHYI